MPLGVVRASTRGWGCSCTLSGGSQLLAGPAWSSKKLQLRRARRCRLACRAAGRRAWARCGRLVHQASSGDRNHTSRTGAAVNREYGLAKVSSRLVATASAGANHMVSQLLATTRAGRASAAGRHSSWRRRDTRLRHRALSTASSWHQAACGRKLVASAARTSGTRAPRAQLSRCWRQGASWGRSLSATRLPSRAGRKNTDSTMAVQNAGSASRLQHRTSSAASAGATRLSRRVSNSCQRSAALIGLASRSPFALPMRGRIQPATCQAARTARWRRTACSP